MNKLILAFVPGGNAAQAVAAVASAFLRFVTSTIGMVLIAAVISYGAGWHMRAKKCDATALRAKLAATQADLTAANDAATMAQAQAAQLEAADRENQGKLNALAKDLKSRPSRACGLSGDDARRLRDIR